MCNEASHQTLNPSEHFVRHTMNVERARATARRDLAKVCLDDVMRDAHEALQLADPAVPVECMRMLRYAVEGDLVTIPR